MASTGGVPEGHIQWRCHDCGQRRALPFGTPTWDHKCRWFVRYVKRAGRWVRLG